MGIDFQDLGYKNRFECIVDQFKQFKKEGDYFEHYFANAIYALCNSEKLFVDYKALGHKNMLMDHGFDRIFMFTESEPIEDLRSSRDKRADLEDKVD